MHAILDLESNGTITQDDQSLEQRLGEACAGRLFVHNDWSKLLVISNKDDLATSQDKRNHALYDRYQK
jgi:hypothetical protein